MSTAIRIVLLAALLAQGWHGWVMTRHDLAVREARAAFDDWRINDGLDGFADARDLSDGYAELWGEEAYVAVYMYDNPEQQQIAVDPGELLDRAWIGYAQAVRRNPVDAWAWGGLAEVALRRTQLTQAETAIDLSALDRRRQGFLDPGTAMALQAAKLAVSLKPAGFQELDILGSVYAAVGDVDAAREAYVESARMMPAPLYHDWGSGYRLDPELYDGIRQGLEQALERVPSFERNSIARQIAAFAIAQQDLETADRALTVAEAEATGEYETYLALWGRAGLQEQLGELEAALETLVAARATGRERTRTSRRMGELQLRLGRFEEACVNLRAALQASADADGLRIRAARACEQGGEVELARQLLETGFTLPTQKPVLARALLDFYRRQGQASLSLHLAQTWSRDFPDHDDFAQWVEEFSQR